MRRVFLGLFVSTNLFIIPSSGHTQHCNLGFMGLRSKVAALLANAGKPSEDNDVTKFIETWDAQANTLFKKAPHALGVPDYASLHAEAFGTSLKEN